MKRRSMSILSLAVCLGSSISLFAADHVSIEVVPAYAPNGRSPYTAPSWTQYVDNATSALRLGVPSVGSRETDPSAYVAVISEITPLEMFYTDFNSWRGLADPNPSFASLAGAFLAETGNNIQFGLHVQSDGTVDFALHDLSWQLDSTDTTNWFDAQGDFSTANYSTTRVGINFGGRWHPRDQRRRGVQER